MKHLGTVTLETERLILRQFKEADIPVGYRNWMSDEKVTEHLRWPTHTSVGVSEKVVKGWIEAYEKPHFYQWAIVLKEIGHEPIGSIGVVQQSDRIEMVHIGYCIGSKWWNKGITSEALAALIPFFFEEVGVNRIESLHDPNNPGSGKVMKKCGLKYEGTLRQGDFSNQGIIDACVYGMLRSDYEQ